MPIQLTQFSHLSRSYEFGLQHEDQNAKILIKEAEIYSTVKITIDGTEYDSE